MTQFRFLLRVFVCGLFILSFAGKGFPQRKKAKNLTRDDIVVKPDRATIYLCFEKRSQNDSVVWLRIANNTIWTIRFRAERQGTQLGLLKLSNGKFIGGLTNKSVAFPHYYFDGTREKDSRGPRWSDFSTASWLPSNTSVLFSVPASQFELGMLYLEYKYEWEFTGAIADESHAPVHRVYFDIASLQDFSAHRCR
jgi:hypothetical protein